MSEGLDKLKQLVMLENHLTSNFYPPKSPSLAPLLVLAIDQYNKGEGNDFIPGITFNDYKVTPVEMIEYFHLEGLVE